jgi:hypothetical protein
MKTAKEYLNGPESGEFRNICDKAGTPATKRQVRKFRLKRGKAYKEDPSFTVNLS